MQRKTVRTDVDREKAIQERIVKRLKELNWWVKKTHGNAWQSGFPDLFAANRRYGVRWIETKRPDYQSFTEAQLRDFPLMSNNGAPIWVLTGEDDWEINKLFRHQNWHHYLQVMKHRTAYRAKQPKEALEVRTPSGPEWDIQTETARVLESEGWFCKNTNGNIWQYGFPDQLAFHKRYGQRWIEYKNPNGYRFTGAQMDLFPEFQAHGVGIWILTDPGQTDRLFKPPNWRDYLK
jgi:hypothetical protein